MAKFVAVHGHFYQPPRENPWYGEVEIQESAAPWHDWNERINSECYSRNSSARILDNDAKIFHIRNNYSRMSFNFGPTLLSWAEKKSPLLLKSLREADEQARARFSGHGSAIAQVYNHIIMPLANKRDKITQVRWGMADFQARFGRPPEGMWLAETAVNTETLEVLCDNGIVFTILSPYQAQAVRKFGTDDWADVAGARVDASRPYRCYLQSGKYIDIFFYDGAMSQSIAFQGLLNDGGIFANRLIESIAYDTEDRLAHVATDGESYGHHHRHGDMALAYALEFIERDPRATLTVYGEFLEQHQPQYAVKIVENSAWSCAHGIERWRSDCGCNSGKGYHQKWRGPLRDALDWLRDAVMQDFERELKKFFRNPWGARDAYIELILDPSADTINDWIYTHAERNLNEQDTCRALRLLEMQRNALLMYTSCGWFFDDIAGIETVQIMCYAARVIGFARELFGLELEDEFKRRLEPALGNEEAYPNGKIAYEKLVEPLSPERLAAQSAIFSLIIDEARNGGERVRTGKVVGDMTLSVGGRTFFYAARLKSAHELVCGVVVLGDANYDELCEKFSKSEAFDDEDLLRSTFGENIFSFQHLIKDMRQFLLTQLIENETFEIENGVRRMVHKYQDVLSFMGKSDVALPSVFQNVAGIILNADIEHELESEHLDFVKIMAAVGKAETWGVALDMPRICYAASLWLSARIGELEASFPNAPLMDEIAKMLELTLVKYHWDYSLSETQNTYYRMIAEKGFNNKDAAPAADVREKFLKIGSLLRFCDRILDE